MNDESQLSTTNRRVSLGRVTISVLAASGLATSFLTIGTAGASSSRAEKSVVVSTMSTAQFGKVLVSGKTLYTVKPGTTSCSSACLKVWPELVLPKGVKMAKAGNGVKASKLGTVRRKGGILQVTYSGKALYRFVGDTTSGQVNGNVTDEWGTWSPVVTSKPAHSSSSVSTTTPSSAPTTTTSGKSTTTTTHASTPAPKPAPTPTTTPPSPPTTTPPTSPPTTTTTTTAPGSGGGVGF
jgi:predicted lipoprotein with Yx(FWY)xxD motif